MYPMSCEWNSVHSSSKGRRTAVCTENSGMVACEVVALFVVMSCSTHFGVEASFLSYPKHPLSYRQEHEMMTLHIYECHKQQRQFAHSLNSMPA